MGWIKRNLIFVIGGVIALGLLGAAGFYTYEGWSRNSAAADKLNEIYSTLGTLSTQHPAPGNDKVNNTQVAKDQEAQINDWVKSAGNYFQPIASIPPAPVTSQSFAAALLQTINLLQHQANDAGVALPPQYDFSFKAEGGRVQFASASLDPLAAQLGEVTTILDIIFSTRVNELDGIQRVPVADEDAGGSSSDYTSDRSVTNDLAIITPYVITFHSFSPELSRVISAFAGSTNAFVIKSINVQPAAMAGAAATPDNNNPQMGINPQTGLPGQRPYFGGAGGMPATPPPQGGLQTVLKEQLLKVTLEVELVKLLPKS